MSNVNIVKLGMKMRKTQDICPSSMSHLFNVLNYLEGKLQLTSEDKTMDANERWPLMGEYEEKIKQQENLINEKKKEYEIQDINQILEEEAQQYGFKRVVYTNEKVETGTATCEHCGKVFKDTKTGKAKYFLNRHHLKCNTENPKHLKKEINKLCDKYGVKELKQILELCKKLE